MFSRVDLPDPDGPMIETNSPRLNGQVHVVERVDHLVAYLEMAADFLELDHGFGGPPASVPRKKLLPSGVVTLRPLTTGSPLLAR